MGEQDAFERTLAAMYDAMLDDSRWPAASALVDEACGLKGNGLIVAEGPKDDIRATCVGAYYRGQRRQDLEREYLEDYHPADERVPRFRQLPEGRLVHVTDLYTAEELKTSPTYNEALRRADLQESLNVRFAGPNGSHIAWSPADPVDSDGWGASRLAMVAQLLPHIRQFVRVRQALVCALARRGAAGLLDNPRLGVIHLDRRGRIIDVNDRARGILRRGDGLSDRRGELCVRGRSDRGRLARLLRDALPATGAAAVSSSMRLRRLPGLPPFTVHIKPLAVRQPDYGARHVAAQVLIVEPGRRHRVDPGLVATMLELTPAESEVAVSLAEGRSVRDIAEATGRTTTAVSCQVKRICRKHSISRQADLVRLVRSLADFG